MEQIRINLLSNLKEAGVDPSDDAVERLARSAQELCMIIARIAERLKSELATAAV